MSDEIRVKFVICTACDRVFPVADLARREHEYDEGDDGLPLVVYDYHCPRCQAKVASWGTG